MYHYKGKVERVIDGDTIVVMVDLGFEEFSRKTFRLLGIDAPEMRGVEKARGKLAKEALEAMILDQGVFLKSFKDKQDKYGRYLAEIFLTEQEGDPSVNEFMIMRGHATPYAG